MDLSKGRIAIFSGEGDTGSWKEYTGARTEQALKTRLTKERCHGQRWAYAYIETDRVNKYTGEAGYQEIRWEKNQYSEDVLMYGEMRTPDMTELNAGAAAAALGRMTSEKKKKSSRENGKKGGKPRTRKYNVVLRHPSGSVEIIGRNHETLEQALNSLRRRPEKEKLMVNDINGRWWSAAGERVYP